MQKWGMLILRFCLGVTAAACLSSACVLAFTDRAASATVFAALFVFLALLCSGSGLESISAFGVSAKLRKKVDEADELLKQMRKLATLSAKLTYHSLGPGARWGEVKSLEYELVAQTDDLLENIGVAFEDRVNAKRAYMNLLRHDLFRVLMGVTAHRCSKASGSVTVTNEQMVSFARLSLQEACELYLQAPTITAHDRAILKRFADSIVLEHQNSIDENAITDRAKELLDGDSVALHNSIFADHT